MDEESAKTATFLLLGTVGFIVLVVIIGIGGYWIDRTYFYPQQRQNTIQDPNRSIANKQRFHDELATILQTDENVQSASQAVQNFKDNHPQPWNDATNAEYNNTYNIYQQQLQARQSAISVYNADASNPDVNRDMDSCEPKHIDPTEDINTEIKFLSSLTC